MFARSISIRLKPNSVAKFTQLIERETLPLLRKQKGFQDEMTFVAPGGAEAVGISFWDQKENADTYCRDAYPEVLKALGKVVEGTPQVRTYEVSNSTFQKIAARVARCRLVKWEITASTLTRSATTVQGGTRESGMVARADTIKAGTILIEHGTPMPESLRLESELDSSGWTSVKNLDRYELAGKINKAGWAFFYMAGKIKATVFGFDQQKTLRAALKRIITNVKSEKCNSLEITEVTSKSFLTVPYVSVSAHSRHIQKGLVFSGQ